MDALHRSWKNTTQIASVGVVAEAIDEQPEGFICITSSFPGQSIPEDSSSRWEPFKNYSASVLCPAKGHLAELPFPTSGDSPQRARQWPLPPVRGRSHRCRYRLSNCCGSRRWPQRPTVRGLPGALFNLVSSLSTYATR